MLAKFVTTKLYLLIMYLRENAEVLKKGYNTWTTETFNVYFLALRWKHKYHRNENDIQKLTYI